MDGKKFWKPAKALFNGTKMTVRCTAFYVLMVFLPTMIFIGWFSATLLREQRMERDFEFRSMLRQSTRLFDDYLRQADFVYGTLQSNKALLDILSNSYLSPADELFAYNTSVSPVFAGLVSSNTVVSGVGVYRYLDSAIRYSNMTGFIRDISQFPYDEAVMEALLSGGNSRHVEIPPVVTSQTSDKIPPPCIVNLYTIYNSDYSKAVGILEVQADLNRIFSGISFSEGGAEFYLKYGNSCFPVEKGGAYIPMEFSVLEEEGGNIFAEQSEYTGFSLLAREKQGGVIDMMAVRNMLLGAGLLLVPAFLFWLFIYRFALKLLRFSRHIRKTREKGLTVYADDVGNDEFGDVVSEYNNMTRMINELIRSVREAEKLKNDASYYAMSSQVNPHFMFNTLENIRMHIELEQYSDASDMLFVLSNFLRYNISMRRESTLFKELGHIRHYLTIYQYRQNHRISFDIIMNADVQDSECPFCILQPIVENCFKHGMKALSAKLEIRVEVEDAGDGVKVCISDNGAGMSDGAIADMNRKLSTSASPENLSQENISHEGGWPGGVGIVNVNNRLKYFYGEEYGLSVTRGPMGGLSCVVHMGYAQNRDAVSPYGGVDEDLRNSG
ncbi:MAG: histidine kinase [Oscillospiraceae bacterium]|nr:histidine kinase [Oscillospiraceae bacterium]